MISFLTPQNILSWIAQTSIVAIPGALLPALFRIRHPRSHITYCYLLMFVCVLAPLVQPWQHATVATEIQARSVFDRIPIWSPAWTGGLPWASLLAVVLISGAALKIGRLIAGLWRLRGLRKRAVVLAALPEALVSIRRLIDNNAAVVCISAEDAGPVTFGLRRPIILLPQSFLLLDEEEQCAVVCHELLHVRRRDWLIMFLEEVAGSLLWFQPAVWMLLNQTRLAREQIVDAEAIRWTAATESYVDALLSIAGVHPQRRPVAAPLFLYKNHLMRRLRSLLAMQETPAHRLIGSYVMMACLVAAAGLFALRSFPLVGEPRLVRAGTTVAELEHVPVIQNDSALDIIQYVRPEYSDAAREHGIQGGVVVQGTVRMDGSMTDIRVVKALRPDLDGNAVHAIEQWRFRPRSAPAKVTVEVSFSLLPEM
jgi:TonB family protein